jgi:hypothetical protein
MALESQRSSVWRSVFGQSSCLELIKKVQTPLGALVPISLAMQMRLWRLYEKRLSRIEERERYSYIKTCLYKQ